MANVLVCVKRVPDVSEQIVVSDDGRSIDTRHLGYTVSTHEECAVELAVQAATATGGEATVLSLGSEDSAEQLRDAIAVGCSRAVLVEADPERFGPADVAAAIAGVVRRHATEGTAYDLVLVGTDAADTGDFQVGMRLAYMLELLVVSGISTFEVEDGTVVAHGDGPDGAETYELARPAVLAIKEGGVTPRYPSIPGRMKAKRTPIETVTPDVEPVGSGRVRLKLPPEQASSVEILGEGAEAAPAVVDLLVRIGVVRR
ncbi:MAG: electron transfer flavoprotein subunit beta/FixA family protein [Propionibacteriales bacterium]|nr:electron transfer flavoprotein subunit beta/FixA family protein [Propionibacteriales bacterium]